MNRKWVPSIFLPLLEMIITLAFAYGCSILNQVLLVENSRTQLLGSILPWVSALTTFLSNGITFLLFWVIMIRTERSRWTGWVFLIVGLLLFPVPMIFLNNTFFFNTFRWAYPVIFSNIALGDSPFYEAKVAITLIGLLILILPKSKSKG